MYQYVLVHTSTNQSIQICVGMCQYELVCTGLYWSVPAYTDWLIYVPVWTSTYFYLLVWASTYQDVPVCTGTYQHISSILVHWHTALSSSGYKAVQQGGTRQYPKDLYPWIEQYKEVHEGTRPLYLHVLPCTVPFRGTGLLGTDMNCHYRFVSTRVQGSMNQYEEIE